mgnify:CR=1 FL=1
MMEVVNLEKKYYDDSIVTTALNGVSFSIKKGEFVAIVGPSGSGKSTLMHIMGFLDRPTSGTYRFKGKSIDSLTDDELAYIRNQEMGFVFQFFNLLPRTTVFDNVKLPLIYSKIPNKKKNEMVKEAIKAVGLSHRINHLSNQLSGGEQQRVAIARAIVNHPAVIFADEPTGNLDSKSGQQIMEILQELNVRGHTIVLVTHEKYTSEMARRIIEMKDGKVVNEKEINRPRLAKDGFVK